LSGSTGAGEEMGRAGLSGWAKTDAEAREGKEPPLFLLFSNKQQLKFTFWTFEIRFFLGFEAKIKVDPLFNLYNFS
jgi:hypothetical protein